MKLHEGAPIYLALVVADLDRAVTFYRDVLGMVEIKAVDVSGAKARKGGFADAPFSFRTFALGPLALKLVTVQGSPRSTRGLVDDFTGVRYISFVVDDLDRTQRELHERGVEFLSEILPREPEQSVGRLVFFRDPDGNLLELYEP